MNEKAALMSQEEKDNWMPPRVMPGTPVIIWPIGRGHCQPSGGRIVRTNGRLCEIEYSVPGGFCWAEDVRHIDDPVRGVQEKKWEWDLAEEIYLVRAIADQLGIKNKYDLATTKKPKEKAA